MKQLLKYYQNHPLRTILFAGLFIRLISVFFSRGFGWIDDQFLVIEIAQSWVDNTDYYHWLPGTPGNTGPVGFSFFYPGLHFLLFSLLKLAGIVDPQIKMIVVRLLHGLWSMLVIYFGYRIAQQYTNIETSNKIGWVLALFWIFPFISVHNLVEFVSVPFLLWGIYLITKPDKGFYKWLIIGLLFGMAFNIRFQTILITGGAGLVLLFSKKIKETIFVALGVLISVAAIQGGIDWIVWKKPFAQLIQYVTYNAAHSAEYTTGPWYVYFLFLAGIIILPINLFVFTGYFYKWKKLLILSFPTLVFLIFHSLYPNKQERFITTIIPLFLISGLIGWQYFLEKRKNNFTFYKIEKGSWIFFWIINLALLVPVSTMFSKKARVDTMVYLSQYKDLNYFVIEDVNKDVLRFPPMFYLEKWIPYDAVMQKDSLEDMAAKKAWFISENQPGFVLFFEPDHLDERVNRMKNIFPELEFEKLIEPGFLDKILHWLNPVNDNQNIYIYRNKNIIPEAIQPTDD